MDGPGLLTWGMLVNFSNHSNPINSNLIFYMIFYDDDDDDDDVGDDRVEENII